MGDDTHMSEKVKPLELQDKEKANREIGLQPPWNDILIRKQLSITEMDSKTVIREYRDRLSGE